MENYKTKEEALLAFNQIKKIIEDFDTKDKQDNLNILMEKRFIELMNQGLTLKIDSEKNEINYYDKDNNLIISIELKNKLVWFGYYKFWPKLESEFNLNYQEINEFLNGMVGKHLNCNGFTTLTFILKKPDTVGKHLNCNGFTTRTYLLGYLY